METNINVTVGTMKRKEIAARLEWWGMNPNLAGRVQALALRGKLRSFSEEGISTWDGSLFVVNETPVDPDKPVLMPGLYNI